jgi:environmental stress-induced protein Ves
MKKIFLCCSLLFAAGVVQSVAGTLYVLEKGGTTKTFATDAVQKLTFTADAVVVTPKTGAAQSFDVDDVVYLSLQEPAAGGNPSTAVSATAANGVSVYPNPASGTVVVSSRENITQVTLFNVMGQQLLLVTPNAPEATLDLSPYPDGIYLLNVFSAGGTSVVKVIKQ